MSAGNTESYPCSGRQMLLFLLHQNLYNLIWRHLVLSGNSETLAEYLSHLVACQCPSMHATRNFMQSPPPLAPFSVTVWTQPSRSRWIPSTWPMSKKPILLLYRRKRCQLKKQSGGQGEGSPSPCIYLLQLTSYPKIKNKNILEGQGRQHHSLTTFSSQL